MGVALIRAIESEKPASVRICNDPLAQRMVPGGIGIALSKWIIASGLYERMAPGATSFIAVRERYIDDFLSAGLAAGVAQVVILGAGFDTRAFRLPAIAQARVFEVDHPNTQQVKLARLKRAIPILPANVTFVAVDFNTQTLEERLLASGYDPRAKTYFLWQGVTYFLTAEGVDSTLAFIAQHSGPGSAVIFDYFYQEVFSDPTRSDVKALRRAARLSGEEYMFGIPRGEIEAFLTGRGFHDVTNLTLEDLKQRYFTGPNAARTVPGGMAIASAVIN